MARPMPLGLHRPYNLLRTSVANRLHEITLEQFSWNSDFAASNVYYRQTQRFGKFSRTQFEVT